MVAKNPGGGWATGRAGAGRAGKTREVELLQLRMSPRTAELICAAAEAGKIPAWRVVELAVLVRHDGDPAPALPPEAQEAAAYMEGLVDQSAAVAALGRARKQALALARHDMRGRTGAGSTEQ